MSTCHNEAQTAQSYAVARPNKALRTIAWAQQTESRSELQKCTNYQSFTYTDNLTNQSLLLDASIVISPSCTDEDAQRQCYDLMRETRKFHIKSIRHKNYKKLRPKLPGHSQADMSQGSELRVLLRRQTEKNKFREEKQQLSRYLTEGTGKPVSGQPGSRHLDGDQPSRSQWPASQAPLQSASVQQLQQNSSTIHGLSAIKRTLNNIVRSQKGRQQNQSASQTFYKQASKKKPTEKIDPACWKISALEGEDASKQKGIGSNKENTWNWKLKEREKQNSIREIEMQHGTFLEQIHDQIRHKIAKDDLYLIEPTGSKKQSDFLRKERKTFNFAPERSSFKNKTLNDHFFYRSDKTKNNTVGKVDEQPDFYLRNTPVCTQQVPEITKLKFSQGVNQTIYEKYNTSATAEMQSGLNFSPICKQHDYLIEDIIRGNYYKVEVELSISPELLLLKQRKSRNNLLHLCVLYNQPEIFKMLIKKCQQLKIDLLNDKNKFNRTPLQLGRVHKILQRSASNKNALFSSSGQ